MSAFALEDFKKNISDNNLDPDTLSLSCVVVKHEYRGDVENFYPLEYEVFLEVGCVHYRIYITKYAASDFVANISRYEGDRMTSVSKNISINSPDLIYDAIQRYFPYRLYLFQ
jgi:hypothetical protein